jgi:SUKH superfamily protein
MEYPGGEDMWHEFIQSIDPASTFFSGATLNQLAVLETAVKAVLPDELKSLLMESNGVLGADGLRLIWSTEEITQRNLKMRTDPLFINSYMPFENLLFFADAGNGDQFAFRIIQGVIRRPDIFVWNHEDDSRTWAAPSLREYLEWWLTGKLSV